ncbi:unnamed protein product [Malus baccata var. baccata]
MGLESSSTHFTNIRSLDTDSKIEDSGNNLVIEAYPLGMMPPMNAVDAEDEGESGVLEPNVGLEFDSADVARDFYTLYAARMGFKVRTGQLYRSRTDGSVSSRRFVCSKEGFQISSRTGCPALIRVQRRDSGKWVVDLFLKDHNHGLESSTEENHTLILQKKSSMPTNTVVEVSHRPKVKLIKAIEDKPHCPSGVISAKRLKRDEEEMQSEIDLSAGLEFNSANEAYQFYHVYAENTGFRIRIGQLFRSKLDGSITSRRFVCSKEGFQHPSRVGCGAYMRIKRQDSGRWENLRLVTILMAPTSRSFVKVVAVLVFITTVTAAAAVVVPGRGGSKVGSRGGRGGGGRSGYGGGGRSGSGVVVPVGGGSGSGGGSTGGNSGHSGSPHSTPRSSSNKNARRFITC